MFKITGFEPLDMIIAESGEALDIAVTALWEMSDEELAEYTDFNELCYALGIEDVDNLILNDIIILIDEMKKRGFEVNAEFI